MKEVIFSNLLHIQKYRLRFISAAVFEVGQRVINNLSPKFNTCVFNLVYGVQIELKHCLCT